jgi:hypothetical protein
MSKSLLFVNEKTYVVHASTPSGAGRLIPPGYAAEGDYFVSSWRAGSSLTRLTEEQAKTFDRSKILITVNCNAQEVTQEAQVVKVESSVPKPQTEIKEEDKPKQKGLEGLSNTLSEAMTELGGKIPTAPELEKMSSDQLMQYAIKFNISGSGSRKDLITLLKKRLEIE